MKSQVDTAMSGSRKIWKARLIGFHRATMKPNQPTKWLLATFTIGSIVKTM